MPHVLILAAGPLCRNPRVLKEATALGDAGFEVTVTSIANIARFEAYDAQLLKGAPFQQVALDRISSEPLIRLYANAERGFGWAARKLVKCGIESPFALGPYYALKRLAEGIAADLTIVHAELPFCIGVSMLAKRRRIAADFEDWHSRDLLPSARATRPLRLLEKTERLLMKHAVFTSAPSTAMASALREAYGGRQPIVIPNTFPLQPDSPPVPRGASPSFFWFSQTIGEGRGLESFLCSWSRTREYSSVSLLGDVSESYRQRLLDLLPPSHRGRLNFLPLTSPEELPAAIAAHDLGLALEPDSPPSRYLTATNKIFQYLNAGLAIVATPTAGQQEVLAAVPGCGLMLDFKDPSDASARLDELLADRARLAKMGNAAREGARAVYCWERSSPALVEAVKLAMLNRGVQEL
jgi:glycosyltransferase involved in cell wall biosynthesis